MSTNELPVEKRIAAELDVPPTPPAVPEAVLNSRLSVEVLGEPLRTRLLLEGFDREGITVEFLLGIHDLADEHDLSLDGISVSRRDS